jgi:hypothetical protein
MDENGKGSSLVPWYVTYSDYKEQNGYVQPGSIGVSWVLPDGDDTYFVSGQIEIQYETNICAATDKRSVSNRKELYL